MKLSKATIRNYRSHRNTEVQLDDLTILIGANGTGKSAVLYALDWLFNGNPPSKSDICIFATDHFGATTRIEVEVEFSDLSNEDRELLGKYARKDIARFRRSWSEETGEKVIGDTLQGPGFARLRQISQSGSASELKTAYNETCADVEGLPPYTNKAAVVEALDTWESQSDNQDRLVRVEDFDASHLFGFAGPGMLSRCFQMILVPASADLASEVGESGKGSVLSQVVGTLTTEVVRKTRLEWEEAHRIEIEELNASIKSTVHEATRRQGDRISRHLQELIPEASVVLRGEPPPWSMRGETSVYADVEIEGHQISLDRQGHGVQRAVMISVLQSLADEATVEDTNGTDGPERSVPTTESDIGSHRPTVLLALEEPEIYQHPIRARHFAKVLTKISNRPDIQVIMATHSPYLMSPERFSALRKFEKRGNNIRVHSTTVEDVALDTGVAVAGVEKSLQRELKGEFSEAFFAELVVLVEGETDKAVVESLAERQSISLDGHGISVVDVGGKGSIKTLWSILRGLHIPCYVVFDEDEPGNASTETLRSLLLRDGESSCECYTCFCPDLESELESWPSVSTSLKSSKKKNAYHYRRAILSSSDEMPAELAGVISKIIRSRDAARAI